MRKQVIRMAFAAILAALGAVGQEGGGVMAEHTFRLYEGVTLYAHVPDGAPFTLELEVRDLNLLAGGPRETLLKVYDPDGVPVVREVIADDGCASANFPDRIGGWDHELQYYGNLYAKGTWPSFRWSAWSDPARLRTIVARPFAYRVGGGKKGVYRVVLAGTPDIYATLRLPAALKVGYAGHPTFMHGHGAMMRKAYLYVPKGSSGVFCAFAEPDQPRGRHFRLTAPDGKVFFDGMAAGGYAAVDGSSKTANGAFAKPGQYDGQLMTLEVSAGANDFLAKVTFQQPRKSFGNYVGMGSSAVFFDDAAIAGEHEVGVGVRVGVFGVIEVEHRAAVADAAGYRRDVIADRVPADDVAHLHPAEAVVERDPCPGDRGGARSPVGLNDVAVDGDLPLAERFEIDHRAQAAPDQALNLDRAPALLAGGRFAPGPLAGRTRQHAVLGGDPAARLPLEPGRQAILERRRHQHMGVAELHKA